MADQLTEEQIAEFKEAFSLWVHLHETLWCEPRAFVSLREVDHGAESDRNRQGRVPDAASSRNGASKSPVKGGAPTRTAAPATTSSAGPPKALGAGTVTRPKAPGKAPPLRPGMGTVARPPGGSAAPQRTIPGVVVRPVVGRPPAPALPAPAPGGSAGSVKTSGAVSSAKASSPGAAGSAPASGRSPTAGAAPAAPAKVAEGAPAPKTVGSAQGAEPARATGEAARTGPEAARASGGSTGSSTAAAPRPAGSAPAAKAAAAGAPARPAGAPPAGMLAILGGMSDFLSSVSNQATGGYSEEQTRGCIACALRLGKPEPVKVLARLHGLAASCWAHSSADSATIKALAVLVGVSLAANKDCLEEAIARRLVRLDWRREHQLTALALLLKDPPKADAEAWREADLLRSLAKAKSLSGDVHLSVLRLILGVPQPGEDADAASALAEMLRIIGNGTWNAEIQLAAMAIAFQTAETLEAVLQKLAQSVTKQSLSKESGTEVLECVLQIDQGKRGNPQAVSAALQRADISAEVRKAVNEALHVSEDEAGWDALKALVDEADEEEDAEDEEEDETDAKEAETDNKAGEEDDDEGEEEESVDLDDMGAWDSESEAASYGGSDLDALHFSDSDMESLGLSGDDGTATKESSGGGLLTAMFRGGSLHSEEKLRDRGRRVMIVEYPNMIWKGQDICVVQKPADWICSASDVDKKKGRKLDPNEDLRNKGFKIMKDLLDYKFAEREKKYIHWWIQLTHEANREHFPNLFDVDQNYGLCHRLDRETSGTVLVGITKRCRTQMRECFHRHYVRKLYVCLAHGFIDKAEQTVDRNLEAMGQKAKLDRRGKRARTHVKVLGYFTRTHKSGKVDEYTLCTCEIAEGRMHQIRLHMSAALGSPIVSEFYYQKAKQMIEDRRWCNRVFLHAYAVGFPDMGGANDPAEEEEDGDHEDEEEKVRVENTEQEWHCCICPLTGELRKVLKDLKPRDQQLKGIQADAMLQSCLDGGLISPGHKDVHCKGSQQRQSLIDEVFFPWSSKVNPIQAGDLAKVRADASQRTKQQALIQQQQQERLEKQKNRQLQQEQRRSNSRDGREGTVALRPKAKAGRRCSASPRRKRGQSVGNKRPRIGRRLRSPGPPPPPARDRSAEPSVSPSDAQAPRQGRRIRSRSGGRVNRRRSLSIRRRVPAAPSRSVSVMRRRGKRRKRELPGSPGRSPEKRGVRSQLGGRPRRGGTLSQG
ncbi:unnamed protein product [Effrenium voratum]|nr:unnamed protein product [Effrenium voratum]